MERILAIDYGLKRSGLSVSDPLSIIANPLAAVETKKLITFIDEYLIKEKVSHLVIGYPKRMNNTNSSIVKEIDVFIAGFRKKHPNIDVVCADERFTSKMAVQSMVDAGTMKSKRRIKGNIDMISANIILQTYLDNRKKS